MVRRCCGVWPMRWLACAFGPLPGVGGASGPSAGATTKGQVDELSPRVHPTGAVRLRGTRCFLPNSFAKIDEIRVIMTPYVGTYHVAMRTAAAFCCGCVSASSASLPLRPHLRTHFGFSVCYFLLCLAGYQVVCLIGRSSVAEELHQVDPLARYSVLQFLRSKPDSDASLADVILEDNNLYVASSAPVARCGLLGLFPFLAPSEVPCALQIHGRGGRDGATASASDRTGPCGLP